MALLAPTGLWRIRTICRHQTWNGKLMLMETYGSQSKVQKITHSFTRKTQNAYDLWHTNYLGGKPLGHTTEQLLGPRAALLEPNVTCCLLWRRRSNNGESITFGPSIGLSVWELIERDNDPDESGGEKPLKLTVKFAPKMESVALPFWKRLLMYNYSRSLDTNTRDTCLMVLSTAGGNGGNTKSIAGEHNTNNM